MKSHRYIVLLAAAGVFLSACGSSRYHDPELTAKILSPVSNMQFDRYARDMGILFERAAAYERSPVVQNTVGNTTNITNNNGATINGVTVGPEQMNMTLAEFFSLLSQIPTKH